MQFRVDRRERLDAFLVRALPRYSRSRLQRHVEAGGVTVDGRRRKPGFRLEPGMTVTVEPITETAPHGDLMPMNVPFDVVYEDDWLLVVDKPAGLAVHPSPTSKAPTLVHGLLNRSFRLSAASGAYRPGIVHRLDKETSGLMLVAKSDVVHHALQKAIQARKIKRIYRALVAGKPRREEFTIRSFIGRHPKNRQRMAVVSESAPGARLAITHCRLVVAYKPQDSAMAMQRWEVSAGHTPAAVSEIECTLETGRTHQIRVHLASVGLPIVGDKTYGVVPLGANRMALRAVGLEFDHPITGETMVFRCDF